MQAELILGAVERKARSAQPSNSSYLEQRVQYLKEDAQLVDEESQGVMMAWEGPLMQAHAKVLPPLLHPYHCMGALQLATIHNKSSGAALSKIYRGQPQQSCS